MKKLVLMVVIAAGVMAAGAGIFFSYRMADVAAYARKASAGPSGAWERVVELPAGLGFSGVTQALLEASVVENPGRFRMLARILGYDRRIKAGEYQFSSEMTPLDILNRMARGRVLLHGLTIPEGFNLYQIAAAAAEKGFGSEADFIAMATSPAIAAEKGIEAKTLEGYLFPDTYAFPKNTAADRIIQTMLERFNDVYIPDWEERARRMGLTRHQVVTLASIIEKETGAAGERPMIASVFHNRLARGMRLQSDPTVIYGIEDFDGNLTRRHLDTPTPYNTYQISGLPPGPIANPGRASLEAVLFPAETDFLYFVARGDGTHQFSTSLGEHTEAVRRYQLGGGER